MKTLQAKLLIGLLPTLAILVALGLWAVIMFYRLGNNIDVILRENFRSVLAAEGMKEAIERMDSGLLFEVIERMDSGHAFSVDGRNDRGRDQFNKNRPLFEKDLEIELGNITVEGEQEAADVLRRLFGEYKASADRFFALPADPPWRRAEVYARELEPTFNDPKSADQVLHLNQENMKVMDRRARENAATSIRPDCGVSLALESVDGPIHGSADGARALARGELDQIVPSRRATSWGTWPMPSTRWPGLPAITGRPGQPGLRPEDRPGDDRSPFPDPVVVVDPTGSVDQANPARVACSALSWRRSPPSPGIPLPLKSLSPTSWPAGATTSCPRSSRRS